MVVLVLAIALTSMRYLDFNIRDLLRDKSEIIGSSIYRAGFYGHVILGIIALLAGPMQFLPSIRSKRIVIHRNIGRIYVIACVLSGL